MLKLKISNQMCLLSLSYFQSVSSYFPQGKKKKKKKKKRRMWAEIICGLVIYKLVRRFFHDDEISDDDTFGSTALFSVAHR